MISLKGVTKYHGKNTMRRVVLDNASARFLPRRNYVVFGGRHSGKSTLLRLLCGLQTPSRGRVERRGTVSIPLGFASQVAPMKSVGELTHFLGILYGADSRAIYRFVLDFTGASEALMHIPLSDLPPQMRMQMNYAIGYGIPADFMLFDDHVSSLEPSSKEQGQAAFALRRQTTGTIVTARSPNARFLGEIGVVLHAGKLYFFDDMDEAANAFAFIEQEKALSAVEQGVPYAMALVRSGDHASALEYLKGHVAENDGDFSAQQMLAELSLLEGDHANAVRISEQMLERDPRSVRSMNLLSKVMASEGRHDEAAYFSLAALKIAPDQKDCSIRLAKSYEALSDFGRAGDVWMELGKRHENPSFMRFALRDYVRGGNWSAVLEVVDDTLDRVAVRELGLIEYKIRALLETKLLEEARHFISTCSDAEAEAVFRQLKRIALTDDWIHFDGLVAALPGFLEGRFDGSATLASVMTLIERKKRLARASAV